MEKWKNFEIESTNYLNDKYGSHFTHLGFSDSTVSDIKYEKDDTRFFIEAKMSSAQSGQFVLLPDVKNKKFIFSPRNKSELDENVEFIIQHMNMNFEKYSKAGTKGEDIHLSQSLFSDWIVKLYKTKNVEFFITRGKDYIVFPVENYGNYFKVSCKFRVKKSGSSDVPKRRRKDVIDKLNSLNFDYEVVDQFLIKTDNDIDNTRFSINNADFLIKKRKDGLFRVRKLSNTQNSNVIFSINLVQEQDAKDLECFESKIL